MIKSFRDHINEIFTNNFIFEGIDVDKDNRIVYYNPNHQNLVDTSDNGFTTKEINGIKTYMLFKRKKDLLRKVSDGNPLVYALKSKNGWSIPEKDKSLIFKIIDEIVLGIKKYDTIILVPSSTPLITQFSKFIKHDRILDKCLFKRTKDEILDDLPFMNFTDKEIELFNTSLDKMKGAYFEAKHFPKNKKLIEKFETNMFKIHGGFNKEINNKSILVVDDVISSGSTLSKCTEAILESYFPKNVEQLSLFSNV